MFMAGRGTFRLLCMDLTMGGSKFATQVGGLAPMQNHCCDAAPQLPSAPNLHEQLAQLGDTTAARVLEVHGKKDTPEQDKGWKIVDKPLQRAKAAEARRSQQCKDEQKEAHGDRAPNEGL